MKSKKTHMRLGAAIIAAASMLMTVPVHAASFTNSTTVSCDGSTVKSLDTVNKQVKGSYSIKVNSATQDSITSLWAVSQNGNALPSKSSSTGQTSSWTDVLPGTYTGKAVRVGSKNCNGIGFGKGNYTLNSTINY